MGNTNADQPGSSKKTRSQTKGKKSPAFAVSQDPVIGESDEADVHKFEAFPEREGPASPPTSGAPQYEELGPLPGTYHEDTLFLVARDPHWLFSYWDFDWTRYSPAQHRDGVARFFLKIRTVRDGEETVTEINPEARNWYIPVGRPDTAYIAEIGHYAGDGAWVTLIRSGTAQTPPDALSEEAQAQFATVPQHLAFERLLNLLTEHMRDGESLLQAVARVTGEGRELALTPGKIPSWTPQQRALLAALVGDSLIERAGLGSAEIDQLLRKQLGESLQSESASRLSGQFYEVLGPTTSSLFSPIGASWSAQPFGARRERGFFLHVNAEIIFYGGTHPDATVWIAGEKIKLNADGTFRYHFTFPDGQSTVPIVAHSPDKMEERSATLSFARQTEQSGDVGRTEQPPQLSPLSGKKE
jgi:uncharacterized protein